MNPFVVFMASPAGRAARVIAGIVLIVAGLGAVGGTGGVILAVVGLVPLAAGLFDICVFAPLLGAPLGGKAIRTRK